MILAIMLRSRSLKQAEYLAVKRIHKRANEHESTYHDAVRFTIQEFVLPRYFFSSVNHKRERFFIFKASTCLSSLHCTLLN